MYELLEVTAVSVHAYAYLADRYAIMRSGASVGNQYGPIVVGKQHKSQDIRGKRIAIPGKKKKKLIYFRRIGPAKK